MDLEAFERRAAQHRALSDPLRLAIADALSVQDLGPSDLEARFEVPSNLLAHHLGVLDAAGLVSRTHSQGDARRRYLSLTEEGTSLLTGADPLVEARRVVFVCTHNSARSPLAAALWAQVDGPVPATSAGTHPAEAAHPLAVAAGRRVGLEVDHAPRALDSVLREGDLVVTVCDQAHEKTREAAGAPPVPALHWSIPDPAREGRPEAFHRTVETLRGRVERLARCTRPASPERKATTR